MLAIDLLSNTIPPLRTSDTLQFAADRMSELRVSHLPIVNEIEFLGLISDHEILENADPTQAVGSLRISLLLSFIYDYQHAYDVLKIMSEQKLSLVPVVDIKKTYLGSVTQPALVEYCSRLCSAIQPGGIIVLEVNIRDLAMSEISKIIESNNAMLLSSFTENSPDSTRVFVTLKLNKTDITPIIATFERYNYIVKVSFQTDQYRDDSLGRYESFMNYLNM